MNILLVEDDRALSKAVCRILEKQGYRVDAVYDGSSAVDYAKCTVYRLIILDVMLPKLNGFEVLRTLRSDGVNTPILMLTARSEVADKVTGLNSGADDYMTKPFETEELLARVGALTRRTGDIIVDEVHWEDLTLDLHSAVLRCGDLSVQLSRKEFEIMKKFLSHPAMTVPKDTLIADIWGLDSQVTENSVEVYMSFLRKKLKYLKSRVTIRNLQRIGYRPEVVTC